ncbi:MAG TPA: PAS domain S-box protein [Desulfuromonadaceae bacterium]|jgi:PAS domain S-box-containing protein
MLINTGLEKKLKQASETIKTYEARLTKLGELEQAVRESQERFEKLFNYAPLPLVVSSLAKGTLLEVNEAFLKRFKYSKKELIDRSSAQLAMWVNPADREHVIDIIRANGAIRDREIVFRDKEGQIFQGTYSGTIVEICGEDCLLSIVNDMTERIQAEEEHASLAAIVESSDDAIIGWTLDGAISSWNKGAESIYGYSADEVMGEKIFILAPAGHLDEMRQILEKLSQGERINHYETTRLTKDNRIIHVSLSISPILGAEGQVVSASSIARDITASKQAEQALRESEVFKQAILDSLLAHIAVIDKHGVVIAVNQSWRRFAEENNISATTVSEGVDYIATCRKAADMKDPLARQALEGIEAVIEGRIFEFTLEYPCHSPTQQRWFLMKVFRPSHDFQGAVIMHLDTTERKRDEEALRQSESKFATIFKMVPALLVISIMPDGRIIEVNEAFLKAEGFQREEVIGHTTLGLGIWTNPGDHEIVIRTLLEQGAVRDWEIRFRRRSGEIFNGLLSAEQIEVESEKYVLAMVKDITERKQMEEEVKRLNTNLAHHASELEAANRELEAFNYTVSHDLRNPLNSMIISAQVIEEFCGDKLDELCRGYLHGIYNGILKMNDLINALLNFASLTNVELQRGTVDLSSLAKEVADELSQSNSKRDVTFIIGKGIKANGDASLLRMVLANLMGNAWKYTGKQDKAVVEFGETEIAGQPTYFVRDNGPGFDMADAAKLFAPFQRLPGTEDYKGHGIGLATVERIIHRHGGDVCADGEPGKGATFYFTLKQ